MSKREMLKSNPRHIPSTDLGDEMQIRQGLEEAKEVLVQEIIERGETFTPQTTADQSSQF